MRQTISLTVGQVRVISQFKDFVFENENALLNHAITLVKKERNKYNKLKESVCLYSELYKKDSDLQGLTEAALNDL